MALDLAKLDFEVARQGRVLGRHREFVRERLFLWVDYPFPCKVGCMRRLGTGRADNAGGLPVDRGSLDSAYLNARNTGWLTEDKFTLLIRPIGQANKPSLRMKRRPRNRNRFSSLSATPRNCSACLLRIGDDGSTGRVLGEGQLFKEFKRGDRGIKALSAAGPCAYQELEWVWFGVICHFWRRAGGGSGGEESCRCC